MTSNPSDNASLISDGFEVIQDFQTGGGIVIALGKWENKGKMVEKQWTN